MMVIRMRLPANEVTVAIVSLSICPKPQITIPTNATSPAIVAKSAGCKRLMRCHSAVMTIPASVATVVAKRMGINTSVGVAAPYEALKAKMVVGMMVSPDVLSTKNIIIGLVAVSLRPFSSCICDMALRPVGVAALSSPNMFDAMFMKMLPIAG